MVVKIEIGERRMEKEVKMQLRRNAVLAFDRK
jgi:hypothetical protein